MSSPGGTPQKSVPRFTSRLGATGSTSIGSTCIGSWFCFINVHGLAYLSSDDAFLQIFYSGELNYFLDIPLPSPRFIVQLDHYHRIILSQPSTSSDFIINNWSGGFGCFPFPFGMKAL